MKMSLLCLVATLAVVAARRLDLKDVSAACQKRDTAVRVLVQEKLASFGIPCEDMCKRMGAYPNCQCPGFAGQPASSDDERACLAKYCQDPTSPCPNDAFVTCVAENTKVSALLQWDAIFENLNRGVQFARMMKQSAHKHAAASCNAHDMGVRVLLQERIRAFGIPCEDMCKRMGAYPNCQCPGFAGQPASSDDERACLAKYCQDPSSPCPNDAFVTCVAENTKVSALVQWDSLFEQLGQGVQSLTQTLKAIKTHKK